MTLRSLAAPALLGLLVATAPPAPLPAQADPFRFVQSALGRHQVVFLGDVHPLAQPKLLVERLIREQAPTAPIHLLALEVASEHQEVIDRYLASRPEDVGILLARPRTLRAHWGASAEYLSIYRAVHHWNRSHAEQPVRIVAADVRGWPMAPLTEGMAAGGFANRDQWMASGFRKVLAEHPDRRVLVFMGGYHGLKVVGGSVTVGAVTERFDRWFAGYLADGGVDIYSILTDARQERGHGATRVFDRLAAGRREDFAVELDSTTDVVDQPLHDIEQEGYALEFQPGRFPLRRAVDALLVLGRPTPTTPVLR